MGLMALTGYRPAKIFFSAKFSLPRKKLPYPAVIFDGQLKTRNAPGTSFEPYPIPVLADPKKIIRALDGLPSLKELSFRRCRQRDHRTSAPKVRFPLLRLSGPTLGDIVKSCVSGTGASLLVPPARSSTINAPKSSGSSSQRSRDDLFRFSRRSSHLYR